MQKRVFLASIDKERKVPFKAKSFDILQQLFCNCETSNKIKRYKSFHYRKIKKKVLQLPQLYIESGNKFSSHL